MKGRCYDGAAEDGGTTGLKKEQMPSADVSVIVNERNAIYDSFRCLARLMEGISI